MTDETHRFDGLADVYARYRPRYPSELVVRLREERGLPSGAHVADVGCGTGRLAEAFLEQGCRVTGIEPSAPMRAQAVDRLANRPGFACLAGSAEATCLPDACVDAIVAGQAFHWFDAPRAGREFRRVLRPGGWVALVWNERHDLSQPFLAAYEALIHVHSPEYHERLSDAYGGARALAFFGGEERRDPGAVRLLVLPNPQQLDWDGLQGRTASASYIPKAGPGREALFASLRALFEEHARDGHVEFLLHTIAYHGTLERAGP